MEKIGQKILYSMLSLLLVLTITFGVLAFKPTSNSKEEVNGITPIEKVEQHYTTTTYENDLYTYESANDIDIYITKNLNEYQIIIEGNEDLYHPIQIDILENKPTPNFNTGMINVENSLFSSFLQYEENVLTFIKQGNKVTYTYTVSLKHKDDPKIESKLNTTVSTNIYYLVIEQSTYIELVL